MALVSSWQQKCNTHNWTYANYIIFNLLKYLILYYTCRIFSYLVIFSFFEYSGHFLSRKRSGTNVYIEMQRNALSGAHWTSRIAETTHRPWIVGGSENSTSIHAVLQDSRWPTSSTSEMTLACTGTSNCIQMQLFSWIPHSLSAYSPRSLLSLAC